MAFTAEPTGPRSGYQASITAWQEVSGSEFAKGALVTAKADLSESETVEVAKMLVIHPSAATHKLE